jgi:hypothetical protein
MWVRVRKLGRKKCLMPAVTRVLEDNALPRKLGSRPLRSSLDERGAQPRPYRSAADAIRLQARGDAEGDRLEQVCIAVSAHPE